MRKEHSGFTRRNSRKFLAMVLVPLMALSALPLQALAATYDVGTADEMINSWNNASQNSDTSNTFNMTNDINMNGQNLNANPDKVYTINGNGHTISNVSIGDTTTISNEKSQPDVTINADVTGSGSAAALAVKGTVNAEVNGDVSSGSGEAIVAAGKAEVTVDGNVESKGGPAIIVDDSSVEVSGDVISEGDAALLKNDASLNVQGDVIAGDSALSIYDSTVNIDGDVISNGQSLITEGAQVAIDGDFIVQPATGVAQDGGLYVTDDSTLTMGANTILETDQLHIAGGSTVDAALVDANAVTVGVITNDSKDTSTFYAYTTAADSGISTLNAAGSSKTQIIGDVEDVYASQNARVEIFGDAKHLTATGNAVVITNVAGQDGTKPETHLPAHSTEDYNVGNTTAHTIIELCQSYTVNSTLDKQSSELRSLIAKVSVDITNELNFGSALWTSLFDHEKVNLSSYMSNRFKNLDIYNKDCYNATSIQNLKQAKNLNTYLISMFKDNLAQAMVDLSDSNQNWKKAGGEETELLLEVIAFTQNIEDASGAVLSKEAKAFLKKATAGGSELSGPEMVEFLRKFGYFTEDDSGIMLAAQRMSKAYNEIAPIMEDAEIAAKLAKGGLTVLDFAGYYLADYTNHIVVLDELLAEQPLSAEMYAAAAELRLAMENKLMGSLEKGVDLIKTSSVGVIKDMWGPLAAGLAIVDIAGLITGGTKDAEDLQNGAALTILAPQLLNAFENSINNVKNGDTSEEAVQMVYMNYTMVRRTIANMCDIMTNIGNKKQEKAYEAILTKLESMDLGEIVDLV